LDCLAEACDLILDLFGCDVETADGKCDVFEDIGWPYCDPGGDADTGMIKWPPAEH
jgi:hypothetical protein